VADAADEHLRRFLLARGAGDAAGMRKWWEALVIDFYDRMDGLVYAAHKGQLDDGEHDLAVSLALTRFSIKLVDTFAGVSMGELVNATKTLCLRICMDVQRTSVRERKHAGTPLDSGWDDPDGGWSGWESGESFRRYEEDEYRAELRDFLSWALFQLDESRRRVLELTFEGADVSEIMQELGISQANAYQRRSRGMKDLAKLKERYDK
jgi:RNA polymerase sigma factor (sigma-70 family)